MATDTMWDEVQAILGTNTECVPAAVLAELDRAGQAVRALNESLSEWEAQYASEVHQFGDAWPGAAIDVQRMRLQVRRAELDLELALLEARRHGYITYDEAVADVKARHAAQAEQAVFDSVEPF